MTDVLVSVDEVCFEARDQYDTAEVFLEATPKEGRNYLKGYDAVIESLAKLLLIQRRLNGTAIHDSERVESLIAEGRKLKQAYRSKYHLSLLPAPADGKRFTNNEVKRIERPTKPIAGPASVVKSRTPQRIARGEAHGNSKLTQANVLTIRKHFAELKRKATESDLVEVGRMYGVTKSAIYAIVTRKTWRHI